MAVVAVGAAVDVSRMFAGSCDAIVAGCAGADDLGVIDNYHGLPHCSGVAIFTDACRQGVRRALARSIRAVMAVYAVSGDGSMIKSRW